MRRQPPPRAQSLRLQPVSAACRPALWALPCRPTPAPKSATVGLRPCPCVTLVPCAASAQDAVPSISALVELTASSIQKKLDWQPTVRFPASSAGHWPCHLLISGTGSSSAVVAESGSQRLDNAKFFYSTTNSSLSSPAHWQHGYSVILCCSRCNQPYRLAAKAGEISSVVHSVQFKALGLQRQALRGSAAEIL